MADGKSPCLQPDVPVDDDLVVREGLEGALYDLPDHGLVALRSTTYPLALAHATALHARLP